MLDLLSLQNSTENPTFMTILFTVLLAFILSSLIAFTFEKTTREVQTPINYLQSIVLVSIVAATVMQAIGDSVARGLGMMGALAIIRFRTTLRTPRNMVFVFASLAVGISCGVYGFVIGITGTIAFCFAAFALRYSPMGTLAHLTGTLKFDLPPSSERLGEVESILNKYCKRFSKRRYKIAQVKVALGEEPSDERILSYEYQLKLRDESAGAALDIELANLAAIKGVKLDFENVQENV